MVRILAISGSTRHRSTNSAACRTAADCAPSGIAVTAYTGLASLPHFDPDLDPDLSPLSGTPSRLPAPVADLRRLIAVADAVLFCTPEYAGTLPGSFKNLLDWTVGSTALSAKPVAWIGVAADPGRGTGAHATLAAVLGYVQAQVVHDACRAVPIARDAVGADGLIRDSAVRAGIRTALFDLATVVAMSEPADTG